ncbi:MAG: FKBP-type peptidyl-prolyl cis-trans isomerase [Myxococcota bacterium]|nr:FKBP-type peptidyl-prolyl cis-trans isomerase [Myxococcota bacterium]
MRSLSIVLIAAVALTGCEPKTASEKTPATQTANTTTAAAKTAQKAPAKKATAADKKATAAKPTATAKPAAAAKPPAKAIPGMPTKPASIPAPADVAAAPADAAKTASGLASKVLKAGTGKAKPAKEDTVKVHYTGWTTDGKMFDSSVARGTPASFPLNRVIKGWTEGVAMMVVGEKRRFWIPGNLAYGDKPARPGAPAGTLVFDVELLEIEKAPTPEENAARFKTWFAAFKKTANSACECKDMMCFQGSMMELRKVKPPTVAPTPQQIAEMDPFRKKLQECAEKLRPSIGKPSAGPAAAGKAPTIKVAPPAKKAADPKK